MGIDRLIMDFLEKHYLLPVLLLAIMVASCGENPVEGTSSEHEPVNQWISANMDFYYYWNDQMPEDRNYTVTPEVFFELLLDPSDVYSDIYPDYQDLLDEINGKPVSAGFSPYFGQFFNSDRVFIILEFVYPGSPADSAGLKRGDIILQVNGQTLSTSNYRFLYNAKNMQNVTLGEFLEDSNQIVSTDSVVALHTRELDVNPVLHKDVIDTVGEKIGYMTYTKFTNGDNQKYLQALKDSIASLKSSGINELVVDLRYNRGGQLPPAEILGNTIAPLQVTLNEEVFVSYQYNDTLQSYFVNNEGPDSENLYTRFSESPNNLGLDRVFFMTTARTASASELLINGLSPHMDVVIIGESTFGKYYGSNVIYDGDGSSNHNYAITPVYTKYANAAGVTDFVDGLTPDHQIDDFIFLPEPLGDPNDPMFAKAIEIITGVAAQKEARSLPDNYFRLYDPFRMKTGNILFTEESK